MKETPQNRPPRSPRRGASPDDNGCFALTFDSLHDLASPVNQVGSIADLILNKYRGTLDAEAEALFGFLQTAVNRLQNLLGGLTTYAQIAGSATASHRCDGNEVLAAALAMIQQTIARNEASVTNDPLPELYCDASQISFVFANLIENSIKFHGESRPEIHVGVTPQKSRWIFSVRDNGMGIDPRYGARIFGAFKRIHNDAYPGAGVGLAIAKHVIERHRGRIWVESDLGRGATFFVALPKTA